MASAIGKALWFALAAAFAVPVVGLELDREARRNDAVAEAVPAPFRHFALEPLIDAAYARGDNATGLALSREFVRRRPVPADGLAFMAYGQVRQGDEDGAVRSLVLAGQRGWRNRFAQDMLVVMAFQSQEWNVAAQRLLALWRVGVTDDRLKEMTAHLLSQPQGVKAFSAQLGRERDWSDAFIGWAGETLDDDALRSTVGAMAHHGARVSCDTLATKLPALVRSGRAGAAAVLWGELCANGRMTAPDDFRFRPVTDGSLPGPFDWQYPEVDGIERSFVTGKSGTTVRYSNRNALRGAVGVRNALLAAGRYTATIDAAAQGEAGFRPLLLRITCYSARGEGNQLVDIALKAEGTGFEIPTYDCVSQELTLMTGRGEGEIRRVTIAPR
ncbi:hypothetical protein WBP07_11360 [Novosphingobium sp. BL-8A]|uniref:hypothetical protein n=1 Tax=Novosphingobium sp. BL-8A TaxID=3127639 RepID=UPI003757E66A